MKIKKKIQFISFFLTVLLFGVGGITLFTPSLLAVDNPIVLENQNPGSTGWQINFDIGNLARDINQEIKGYASAVSINKGENINLYVTVNPAQPFTIDVYRMGWYNGAGGRLMQSIGPLNGVTQPTCPIDAQTGMIECNWAVAYTLTIPTNWTTGIYLAKLTNAQNFQSYIIFTVRDDGRVADFLYQQPVTTYQAYNNYPADGVRGKSLYDFNSAGALTGLGTQRAVKVSFDRPYGGNGGPDGGGQFTDGLFWERYFVGWVEQQGYDVSYTTDLDVHLNGAQLLNYKGFLSAGHDEYWSKPMFDAVEAARNAGVNLGFFNANASYWQIRFEPATNSVPNRVVVCYKDPLLDPVSDPGAETILWRDLGRAEQTLVGVQFSVGANDLEATAPYIVQNSSHWVWSGTGFVDGSVVPGIVGYEADRLFTNYPLPVSLSYTTLSSSPYEGDRSESAVYQAPSGAWVFGAGTSSWPWALGRTGFVNAGIQQATKNILDRFLQPGGAPTPTDTPLPPTATATDTPLPPTATTTPLPPTPTNTPLPPTATATNTLLPPTPTNTALPPTVTPTNTSTPIAGCNNLIQNASFEQGLNPWLDQGGLASDPNAHTGANALRIGLPPAGTSQIVSAQAGQTYIYTGYYKTSGSGSQFRAGMDFLNSANGQIGQVAVDLTPSTGYRQFSVSGVAPANTTKIRVWVSNSGGNYLSVDTLDLRVSGCGGAPTPTAAATPNCSLTIQFVNQTSGTVRVYWVNASGAEVLYRQLFAGQSYTQQTFFGHVWRMRDSSGNLLKQITADQCTNYTVTITAPITCSGTGSIVREYWSNIDGPLVSNLTADPRYPTNPTGVNTLTTLEGPSNWNDNYGSRIRGYLCPPSTGSYTFWIAGDDYSQLFLSNDENPVNERLIASVPGWTLAREWTKYAEQRSASISLQAGKPYFIDVLHKEGTGSDNVAVAWQGPGFSQRIIAGQYLKQYRTAISSASDSFDRLVNQSIDDVEQDLTAGTVYPASNDLELGRDVGLFNGPQVVGMRFRTLNIPKGATITRAYIEFVVSEADSGTSASVSIRGQAADSAGVFGTARSAISALPTTSANVNWSNIPRWGIIFATQRTPDLKTVVQEIVNRPGWLSGNNMAFFITGSGRRVAYAYDDFASWAPQLHVEWSMTTVAADADAGELLEALINSAPAMTIDYADGAPGSRFVILGENFTPNSTVTLLANGVSLGAANVDGAGYFDFTFNSDSAQTGQFVLATDQQPTVTVTYELTTTAPLRTEPVEETMLHQVYLPVMNRE